MYKRQVESEAMNQALAMVVAAQGKLPMSRVCGMGTSASSVGQFFPTARHGAAMNMVNAKYGSVPGLKAYTHVSDQFCTLFTPDAAAPHRSFNLAVAQPISTTKRLT
ncbi:Tn3 family transposase [Klebsiella pneumoniae]|uniref:Tn3 family transposase n=1 Tax=Klebsiella pneumoniae TaxID=573 RepID=UPI0025556ED3|nr:Tn3 family transposase [Klebsiella pneumoniae]MDK9483061.1 Tn3 family transposase [Klebsiella pneumoniae]